MDRRALMLLILLGIGLVVWLFGFEDAADDAPIDPREATEAEGGTPSLRGAGVRAIDPPISDAAASNTAPEEEGATSSATIHEGTFTLRHKEGYSFGQRAVLPENAGGHDLTLHSLAGGASGLQFRSTGGKLASARVLHPHLPRLQTGEGLWHGLLRGHPDALPLNDRIDADSRRPCSDVFLLRTAGGAWVKLAVVDRDTSPRAWTAFRITLRYALNQEAPEFASGKGDLLEAGFEVDTPRTQQHDRRALAALEAAQAERERGFKERMVALDARAAVLVGDARAEGQQVAAVLDRRVAKDLGALDPYVASTYSFEHQTRDDVKTTRNDWDFVYGKRNDRYELNVRTVTDDRGSIWDLGMVSFEQALAGSVAPTEAAGRLDVQAGHMYLIHTLDSETDTWVLMKVLEANENGDFLFAWHRVEDPTALRQVLEGDDRNLAEPLARLQVMSAHGGGNPNRAFLDGSKNAYVDELSPGLLDLRTTTRNRRRSAAHVTGGLVPSGQVFRVQSVEITLHFDEPGRCEAIVQVGPFVVLRAETDRDSESAPGTVLELYSTDRGTERHEMKDMPIRRTLAVDIPIRRDQEMDVFIEGASYTRLDVVLRGRFEPAPQAPDPLAAWGNSARRQAYQLLSYAHKSRDRLERLQGIASTLANIPGARVWLARLRAMATDTSYRASIDALSERMR